MEVKPSIYGGPSPLWKVKMFIVVVLSALIGLWIFVSTIGGLDAIGLGFLTKTIKEAMVYEIAFVIGLVLLVAR